MNDKFDLKQLDGLGDSVHKDILEKWGPLFYDIDKVIYEELINMLDGTAATIHLELNSTKSGLEAWRSLNASNDPRTYQQSEIFLAIICKACCKSAMEFQRAVAELEHCYAKYKVCTKRDYDTE